MLELSAKEPSDDEALSLQASRLEELLPRLLRRLFTLDPDHPVAEMPLAQLRACSILMSGPRSMSVLSDEMGISVSAMTQIADRMERSDLVERVVGQEDRRQKNLQLTNYGAELMRSRREMRIRRAAAALKALMPEARETTLAALQGLLEAANNSAPVVRREESLTNRLEQG